MNETLVVLGADWYWEQDASHRFSVIRSPSLPGRGFSVATLGRARWELEGAEALTMTWEEHRAQLSAHLPFHDFQFVRVMEGERRCLSASGEPMFDGDGRFLGYRGTTRDITQHWTQRAQLDEARSLIGVAAVLGRFGAWSVDVATGQIRWTEQARALYELPLRPETSLELAVGRYAPQDRGRLMEAYERCVRDGTPYDLELQAFTGSGRPLWVRVIGVAVRDADGRVVRVQGAVQDIDASKAAADAHRELAERFRAMNEALEQRVRERTEDLQRLNEELSAFTLAVAHDLRAPLAGVSGFVRAAAERLGDGVDPLVLHYLARAEAGAARMEDLLAGLMSLSQIGRDELVRQPVDLSAVAREVLEALRAAQPERRVVAHVHEGLRTHADRRLLRTLMENLVGNAWKFSAQRDPAQLEIGCGADGAFFVRDNGAGFDMAHAHALFAPFRRLHDPAEFPGVGIGLASTRRVVERHGGRIWAESAPGAGAVFRFTLAPQR